MLKNDLIFECTYYGRKPDSLGCLYFRPINLPVKNAEVLFFCFYTLKILTEKKISLITAQEIQKKLSLGSQLKDLLQHCEAGENSFGIQMIEYKGFSKLAFSSSILFNKKMRFRFGYIGFGFFMNKKKYNFCAEHSVYGLLYTIYKLNKENPETLNMLWNCAEQISNIKLGKDLYKGIYQITAKKIYKAVTEDTADYLNN